MITTLTAIDTSDDTFSSPSPNSHTAEESMEESEPSVTDTYKPVIAVKKDKSEKVKRLPYISLEVSEVVRLFKSQIKEKYESKYGDITQRRWKEQQIRSNIQAFFTDGEHYDFP